MFDWFVKTPFYEQRFKPLWNNSQYLEAIKTSFDHMPDLTYPGTYDASEDHNVLNGVFWWRELWHAIGGAAISLGFFVWCPWWIPTALIWAGFQYKEFAEDVKDQGGKADFKNFVDPIFWALGAFIVSYLGSLI